MFGPGGQPILMGQIPIIPQQFQQQQAPRPGRPVPKVPRITEEQLQEKGRSAGVILHTCHYRGAAAGER